MRPWLWGLLFLFLLGHAQDLGAQERRVRTLEEQVAQARRLEAQSQARIQALDRELARLSQRVQGAFGGEGPPRGPPWPAWKGSAPPCGRRSPASKGRCAVRRGGSPSWKRTWRA
ncbi:MAG: hypothetical protein ABDH20_06805 [Thermus sp.]